MKKFRNSDFGSGISGSPRSGFTLLEVILAIALTALVMSMLYGVVSSTILAQRRVEAEMFISEVGPALTTQIRQDLDAVFQPDAEGEYFVGIDRTSGSGESDRVDFLATVMAYGSEDEYEEPGFHSVNEIGYQLVPNDTESGVGVLYRRLDYFVDEDPLRGGRLVELYDRVLSFDVQYFDGTQWQKSWATKDNEGNLPEAIKVELKIRLRKSAEKNEDRTYTITVTRP